MNYELKVTETKNKAGKYHYQVIDEAGNIISERKSNREYVACSINSGFYFGRLDLINKGDHKKFREYWPNATEHELNQIYTIAYRK